MKKENLFYELDVDTSVLNNIDSCNLMSDIDTATLLPVINEADEIYVVNQKSRFIQYQGHAPMDIKQRTMRGGKVSKSDLMLGDSKRLFEMCKHLRKGT